MIYCDNMKFEQVEKNLYRVYLNKKYYLFNKETIEKCVIDILQKLKRRYNLELYSIFNVLCYINNNYGIILEIEREYDPFALYMKKTDLKIKLKKDSKFLYSINDYFTRNMLKKSRIYLYNFKYYLDVEDELTNVIEHVDKIMYGDIVYSIINNNA